MRAKRTSGSHSKGKENETKKLKIEKPAITVNGSGSVTTPRFYKLRRFSNSNQSSLDSTTANSSAASNTSSNLSDSLKSITSKTRNGNKIVTADANSKRKVTGATNKALRKKVKTNKISIKSENFTSTISTNNNINNNNNNIDDIVTNNNHNNNNNENNVDADAECQQNSSTYIVTVFDTNDANANDLVADAKENLSKSKTKPNKKQTKGPRVKRKYLCHICDKEFLGGNDLRKHIRIHTNERPFECTHCGQRFRQGGCLKNHIASQHGTSQSFTCYYCNKSFPIKERLRLHMRLHSGEKPYRCKICNKQFARGGQLTQHAATHNGIKKYHCTECTASFSCLMNLRLHLKGHANERDYTCHMCGKSFIRPDALKNHLACFHENVKAFYCHLCSRTFKGHLPQHMRTHQNVKSHGCADCGATFSQKSQLIVHQRIHSGERPYRCQVCWQAFAHSSVLKLHIRKHTGEKPFKCMVCKDIGTAFSQLPHLKTHMRAIHGMDKAYNCEFCSEFFKTKHELQEHKLKCSKAQDNGGIEGINALSTNEQNSTYGRETAMSLSKMRLLVAVLLKKISTKDRLKQLGFDKRLIDNVLIAALEVAGQPICEDASLGEADRLRTNVKQFLEWTVPDAYMKKFKREQRSPEELLEDLTSSFKRSNSTESSEQETPTK